MNPFRSLLALILILQTLSASAQAVDNTGMERALQEDRYIRLNYQNDFFTATDYYFTQGVLLEYAHPGLRKFPLSKLMISPRGWRMTYGIGLEQGGYTPLDYVPSEILYGDRPFAGTLSFKNFAIATDTLRKRRISGSLNLGVIGPWAGAGEIQTYIHERTPNALPHGWHNQIGNDVIVQYHAQYEQQLISSLPDFFTIAATGALNAGTISDKATAGLTFMAGYFDSSFGRRHKKISIYFYDHPEFNVVVYDATLQGGLFNHSSPYTISAVDITRGVFRNNWGIVVRLGKVYLEYYQSFMTREFSSGKEMRNGGLQIGCSF